MHYEAEFPIPRINIFFSDRNRIHQSWQTYDLETAFLFRSIGLEDKTVWFRFFLNCFYLYLNCQTSPLLNENISSWWQHLRWLLAAISLPQSVTKMHNKWQIWTICDKNARSVTNCTICDKGTANPTRPGVATTQRLVAGNFRTRNFLKAQLANTHNWRLALQSVFVTWSFEVSSPKRKRSFL